MKDFLKNNITEIMALLWSVSILTLFYILMTKRLADLEGVDRDIVMVLVGFLTSSSKDVLTYFFGSSIGSKKKTDMMNKQKTPPPLN